MAGKRVGEQPSAQAGSPARGETAGGPAASPTHDAREMRPTVSLTGLAEELEGVADRLTQYIAEAVGPDPQEGAEQCFQDMREVCSGLRGMSLLLDSMLSENTVEHREAFKALVSAFGEKVRGAGHVNRGMVERMSQQMEDIESLSEADPADVLIERLRDVVANVRDTAGEVGSHIEAVAADVDAASQQIAGLENLLSAASKKAHHDELTGTGSRLALDMAMYEATGDGTRRAPWCFLLIDIDRFRAVNEALGRSVGDALLCKVARMIEQALPGADQELTLGRYGGEEFGIVVHDTSILKAGRLGEAIRDKIAASKWSIRGSADGVLHATVSIGITEYRSGDTVRTITERSEAALRKAKSDGRNRVAMEHPIADVAAVARRAAMRGRL